MEASFGRGQKERDHIAHFNAQCGNQSRDGVAGFFEAENAVTSFAVTGLVVLRSACAGFEPFASGTMAEAR